jgi:phage protein D
VSDISNFPGFGFDPFKTDTLIGDIDPFLGRRQQTSRMRAFCSISVGGVDVTNQLDPHLISVRVLLGSPSTSAEIELDDRDATLPIPPIGSRADIALGWQSESMIGVFSGLILDFEHGFGRKQGGRRMWVHADGADLLGKLKEPIQDSEGEGAPPGQEEGKGTPMSGWIQKYMGHAGVSANVAADIGKFEQDHWSMSNESPMHHLTSMADKFGFMHQFTDGNIVNIERPGQRGVSCQAVWRDNLIGWRVRPFAARSAFGGAKAEQYKAAEGKYALKFQDFANKAPWNQGTANIGSQIAAATASAAGGANAGAQSAADSSFMGNGRIIINGEPGARWNSYVQLQGARPGVDGLYLITTVEHVYSRQGFITTLEVLPWAGAPSGQNVNRGFLPKPAPNMG